MTEKPYTIRTAFHSNLIALAFTLSIIGIWYGLSKYKDLHLWQLLIAFVVFLVTFYTVTLALIHLGHVINYLRGRPLADGRIDILGITSDANQWAPIAGASMIVGWSARKTDFATREDSLLILLGLLYSLWCIALTVDLRKNQRNRTLFFLFFSHLAFPAIFGAGLASGANLLTALTPEEARQDECYKARAAFITNQCKPIVPLSPEELESLVGL